MRIVIITIISMFCLTISFSQKELTLHPVSNKKSSLELENSQQNQVDSELLDAIMQYQKLIKNVPVADNVIQFAVDFVSSTRSNENNSTISQWLDWGAGPRASMYLILAAKAKAIIDGRTTPDIADVKQMINPVLRHRIIPNFNAEAEGLTRDNILEKLLESKQ